MPSPPAKKTRPRTSAVRRWLSWILFVLGLLAGGVWLWIRWDENQGRKEWEAYQAEAVQRGVKFEFGEFVRPPIAARDNFAESPLFRRSYETKTLKFPYFSLPERDLPQRDHGKALDERLEARRQDFVRMKWLAKNDPTPAPAALRRALQRFEAPWALLVEAAAKPDARFAVGWERGYGYASGDQDHLWLLQSAAELVELRAQILFVEGKFAEALAEWRLLWRLAEALKREPGLLSWMTKWNLQARALNLLSTGIEQRVWRAAELEAIQRVLAKEEPLADVVRAYAAERAFISDEYLHMHERWLEAMNQAGLEANFTDRFLGIYHGLTLCNRDIDHVLATIDVARRRFVNAGKRSIPEPAWLDVVERRRYRIYRLLSLNSVAVDNSFLATTRLDQARLACALERYRLAKNSYPENLTALVPGFIEAIPHDVFDGAPLRYRRNGETFLLYAVGADGQDDRGKSVGRNGGTGDWVWENRNP